MKKILLIVLTTVLFAVPVFASPFLVCDPQTGVTSYKITGPGWIVSPVPAQADGSLRMNLATSTAGLNPLTVEACWTSPEWGEQCSGTVPFVFTRPAAPSSPANLRLLP